MLNLDVLSGHGRFRAMREERKPKRINSQMPFDSVRCFVNAKPFGFNSSVAGVLNGLRINDD
jgi:hypothetical protein